MTSQFQLSLPGSRPRLDGVVVAVPAQFYERKILGGNVYGLWIGGRRMFGVTIYDSAGRKVGAIGALSPQTSDDYDSLRRVLVAEALRA